MATAAVAGYDGDEDANNTASLTRQARQNANLAACQAITNEISPCQCEESIHDPSMVDFVCEKLNLDDATMQAKITAIPATLEIYYMSLNENNLLVVPPGLQDLEKIHTIKLMNNRITIVRTGEFDVKSPLLVWVDLTANDLDTIEDNAFPKGKRIIKLLFNKSLTEMPLYLQSGISEQMDMK